MNSEDELERQRNRADRVQSALDSVKPDDLKTLLDDEIAQLIASLGRVLGEAQSEQRSRGG